MKSSKVRGRSFSRRTRSSPRSTTSYATAISSWTWLPLIWSIFLRASRFRSLSLTERFWFDGIRPAHEGSRLHPGDLGRSIDDIKLKVKVDDLADKIRETIATITPKEWEIEGLDGGWF